MSIICILNINTHVEKVFYSNIFTHSNPWKLLEVISLNELKGYLLKR